MTAAEREQLCAYATGRARRAAAVTASAFEQVSAAGVYADTPARRAYEAALQDQGRHIGAVADIELHTALSEVTDHEQALRHRARIATDAGFAHADGTTMRTRDVIRAIRSAALDEGALDRFKAISQEQTEYMNGVRRQREGEVSPS